MHALSSIVIATLILLTFTAVVQAETDELYEACKSNPRGPWCYQEAVEQINNPDLCENILTYWPKASGVHGWCYYQLAIKNKDCNLCDAIRKDDVKTMCVKDVCKR